MPSIRPVHDWLSWMRTVRHATDGTVDVYLHVMRKFADYAPDVAWDAVDAPLIESFLLRPRRGGKTAMPATQARERATIQSFYSYAVRRGISASDPTVDVPTLRVRNRQPKAIDDATWNELWSSPIPREDKVWLGLGAYAGLRRREIASLAPSDVDMQRGLIRNVQRKGGDEDIVEFEEGARIVGTHLPVVLPDWSAWVDDVAWLARSRRGEQTLITVDAATNPKMLNSHLERLLRRAGMQADTFTPHALRHTCATNLLRCGVPLEVAADYLGHSSVEMTRRYLKTAGRLREWSVTTAVPQWGGKGGHLAEPLPRPSEGQR